MSHRPPASIKSLHRRKVLQGLAAATAMALPGLSFAQQFPTAKVNTTKLAVTDTEVTVGQLHSATGTMAISETGSIQAEQLAIDQINAMGGILGRKIKIIKEDGASDWPTFAEKAKKLLVNDKVAAVFGCWTSASRKAVLPVFEKENGLLYYPTFYEGLEQSKNVFYTGQEATQQILCRPRLDREGEEGQDLLPDRLRLHLAAHVEQDRAQAHRERAEGQGRRRGVLPAGQHAVRLADQQDQAEEARRASSPIVVGGSNVAFYKQLKAAGITGDKQILLTISVTEDELLGIGGENMAGFYSSMKYFQSLDNANNKKFVDAFKAKYGANVGDRRRDAGRLPRPVAVEGRGGEGRQLRRRQGRRRLARHRAEDRARRLREAPPEPPPVEQDPHRPGADGRPVQGGLRVRPDRAESVPQGLPVSMRAARLLVL